MCDGITIGGNVSIQISGPCVPPDGSVTAAKINSGNAVDGQVLTADGNGGAAWEAPAGGGPGYLEYVARLTPSNESGGPPVVTVLKNTLGGTVVWTRNSIGVYFGTLANAFPPDKTVISPSSMWDLENASFVGVSIGNGSFLQINTFDVSALPTVTPTDGIVYIALEVRVYP